jgi:hypothetical protein
MSRLMISALFVGMAAAVGTVPAIPAAAADLAVPARHAARWCGECGCLHVTYVHHRSLASTYGLDYDPRNYDGTQPHYYYGAVRAYPRYWVEAAAPPAE